jgi:hypothetical protein
MIRLFDKRNAESNFTVDPQYTLETFSAAARWVGINVGNFVWSREGGVEITPGRRFRESGVPSAERIYIPIRARGG